MFIIGYHFKNKCEYFKKDGLINRGINIIYNKTIKNYKKLYQASVDGYSIENFHKKCDGKAFTVIFITNDKDKIFGGFTEIEWDSSSGEKKGYKGFIFSISNNKIYYTEKGYYFIYCDKDFGPTFLNGFSIDKFNLVKDNTYVNSEFNLEGKEYVLQGERYGEVKDYVVYQIELE